MSINDDLRIECWKDLRVELSIAWGNPRESLNVVIK